MPGPDQNPGEAQVTERELIEALTAFRTFDNRLQDVSRQIGNVLDRMNTWMLTVVTKAEFTEHLDRMYTKIREQETKIHLLQIAQSADDTNFDWVKKLLIPLLAAGSGAVGGKLFL